WSPRRRAAAATATVWWSCSGSSAQAAQQDSLATSRVKVCAVSFSASAMVRYGHQAAASWSMVIPAATALVGTPVNGLVAARCRARWSRVGDAVAGAQCGVVGGGQGVGEQDEFGDARHGR